RQKHQAFEVALGRFGRLWRLRLFFGQRLQEFGIFASDESAGVVGHVAKAGNVLHASSIAMPCASLKCFRAAAKPLAWLLASAGIRTSALQPVPVGDMNAACT